MVLTHWCCYPAWWQCCDCSAVSAGIIWEILCSPESRIHVWRLVIVQGNTIWINKLRFWCCFLCSFVSRHINEYKRKTDSQVQMFEIIQEIDNCPVRSVYILVIYWQHDIYAPYHENSKVNKRSKLAEKSKVRDDPTTASYEKKLLISWMTSLKPYSHIVCLITLLCVL